MKCSRFKVGAYVARYIDMRLPGTGSDRFLGVIMTAAV